jgi:hypothetical protein
MSRLPAFIAIAALGAAALAACALSFDDNSWDRKIYAGDPMTLATSGPSPTPMVSTTYTPPASLLPPEPINSPSPSVSPSPTTTPTPGPN